MKCRVCSTEIPEGKRCCPKCGRVVTAADSKPVYNSTENYSSVSDKTMVYRPASTSSAQPSDKTINITDIFSSDPNAPVYTDPHTYDKATADILEYDRMFMSRKAAEEDVKVFEPAPAQKKKSTEFTSRPEYNDSEDSAEDGYDEFEEAPSKGMVIRDKKRAKPRFNFNIKYLILAIAVLAGLSVIVFGTIQLGKQFGIINSTEDEPQSGISAEKEDKEEKNTKNNDESPEVDNSYTAKAGVYTVYSDQSNIFVYKSVNDQRIIATIPNKTILEINEIDGDFGKTTYNSYTGWVKLSELKFTPNEVPETETETETEPSSDTEIPDYQPGTYTVTLNGTNTELNVRSIGSTDGEIISTLTEGTQVTVEEVKSSWGKIYIGDVEGWVYMEYLK